MMENNKLNEDQIEIYDEEGNKYLFNILFTFENDETGEQYVFIYDEANPEDVILMKYQEDGSIQEVTDEKELEMAEEVLDVYNNIDENENSSDLEA